MGHDEVKRLGTLPFGVWRYRRWLPVVEARNIVTMAEGGTPLIEVPRLARRLGMKRLFVKDEGRNPTGNFKARGASVAVSRFRELGFRTLAMPTVGSGGSAWSAYAARAGIDILVGFPSVPPVPDIGPIEARFYGARVSFHPGPTHTAFLEFRRKADEADAAYVGAFVEPYRLEGEKTIGFEVADQFGWKGPDWIIWPTGGGVGLAGLAKAFTELSSAGVLTGTLPGLVSVQHELAAPIAKALAAGEDHCEPVDGVAGLAPGLWVSRPNAEDLILGMLRGFRTSGVGVSDEGIRRSMSEAARDGVLVSPEGAAGLAAVERLLEDGTIHADDVTVVVNTATGLRYPHLLRSTSASD